MLLQCCVTAQFPCFCKGKTDVWQTLRCMDKFLHKERFTFALLNELTFSKEVFYFYINPLEKHFFFLKELEGE